VKNKYDIDGEIVKIYCKNRKQEEFTILIDKKNLDKVNQYNSTWYAHWKTCNQTYYATITLHFGTIDGKQKNKSLELQKVILPTEKGYRTDHINHDTMDNREDNLRVASHRENLINRNGRNSNNKSGCRNVYWCNSDKRWLVQFQVDGKGRHFGRFKLEDKDKAIELANRLRTELYGEFAGKS
jgi:hypothetical protein